MGGDESVDFCGLGHGWVMYFGLLVENASWIGLFTWSLLFSFVVTTQYSLVRLSSSPAMSCEKLLLVS